MFSFIGIRRAKFAGEIFSGESLRHVEANLMKELAAEFLKEFATGAHLDDDELVQQRKQAGV